MKNVEKRTDSSKINRRYPPGLNKVALEKKKNQYLLSDEKLYRETNDIAFLIAVFACHQLLTAVQQVEEFATVDLKEAHLQQNERTNRKGKQKMSREKKSRGSVTCSQWLTCVHLALIYLSFRNGILKSCTI